MWSSSALRARLGQLTAAQGEDAVEVALASLGEQDVGRLLSRMSAFPFFEAIPTIGGPPLEGEALEASPYIPQ